MTIINNRTNSVGYILVAHYVSESVGIAAGMFITAVHLAGLVTLTHTPSPMTFLQKILKRPPNEKAFLLLPVGYPASDVQVPDLRRKEIGEVLTVWDGSMGDSGSGGETRGPA